MRSRRELSDSAYYAAWSLVLAAFIVIGGRELWIGSHGNFIKGGSFASTDAYLEALIGVPSASAQCVDVMSAFYGKRDFFYFCPRRDAAGDFVYDLLSYLSWPQQIRKIETESSELNEKLASIDSETSSAVIIFGFQQRPDFARGSRLGPKLWIGPAASSQ